MTIIKAVGYTKKNWGLILVIIGVVISSVVLSHLAITKHKAFASSYDLANMDQTVWNTSQGRIFTLSKDTQTVSRFSFHADLILILLAPFYFIWNNVGMLLIIQATALSLSAVPVYLLTKNVLKSNIVAVALSAAFLIYPWLQWIALYDFHGIALAIPMLLTSIYLLWTKRTKAAWIFILMGLLTKENVGLFVGMTGILFYLFTNQKKTALMVATVGFAWFLAFVFLVMPVFSGEIHWAWEWYGAGGNGDNFSLQSALRMPVKFIGILQEKASINYYKELLFPFSYIPLLGLPWLALAIPDLAINLLSSQGTTRALTMHYHSLTLVALIIATIFGLKYFFQGLYIVLYKIIGTRNGNRFTTAAVYASSLFMLFSSMKANYFYSPLPTTPGHWPLMYAVGEDEILFAKELKNIPASASTASSSEVRPHLTHRENSFNLPSGAMEADYIAMTDQNRQVGGYTEKSFEKQLIDTLKSSSEYDMVVNYGHFWLFKRKGI